MYEKFAVLRQSKLRFLTNISCHTNFSVFLCTCMCVNQMATNVEQNKKYYVYFEIFNQITHKMGVFYCE